MNEINAVPAMTDETSAVLRLCVTELRAWMKDHGQDVRTQEAIQRANALLAAQTQAQAAEAVASGILAGHFVNAASNGESARYEQVGAEYAGDSDVIPLFAVLPASPVASNEREAVERDIASTIEEHLGRNGDDQASRNCATAIYALLAARTGGSNE